MTYSPPKRSNSVTFDRYNYVLLRSRLISLEHLLVLLIGWLMSPDEGQEEYEETQAELKKYEDDVSLAMQITHGRITPRYYRSLYAKCSSAVFSLNSI